MLFTSIFNIKSTLGFCHYSNEFLKLVQLGLKKSADEMCRLKPIYQKHDDYSYMEIWNLVFTYHKKLLNLADWKEAELQQDKEYTVPTRRESNGV